MKRRDFLKSAGALALYPTLRSIYKILDESGDQKESVSELVENSATLISIYTNDIPHTGSASIVNFIHPQTYRGFDLILTAGHIGRNAVKVNPELEKRVWIDPNGGANLTDGASFEEKEFGAAAMFNAKFGVLGTVESVDQDIAIIVTPHEIARQKLAGIVDEAKLPLFENIFFGNPKHLLEGGTFSFRGYPNSSMNNHKDIINAHTKLFEKFPQNGNLLAIYGAEISNKFSGSGAFWDFEGKEWLIGPVVGEDVSLLGNSTAFVYPLAIFGYQNTLNLINEAITDFDRKQ